MKASQTDSSVDALKLIEKMHELLLGVRRARMGDAFAKGTIAFILVALLGQNIAIGLLGGIMVYLYFRYESLTEYGREVLEYQESKREIIEGL